MRFIFGRIRFHVVVTAIDKNCSNLLKNSLIVVKESLLANLLYST